MPNSSEKGNNPIAANSTFKFGTTFGKPESLFWGIIESDRVFIEPRNGYNSDDCTGYRVNKETKWRKESSYTLIVCISLYGW